MYSLYLRHWKFMKTLSCKERGVLGDYKSFLAFLFNSILYSSTNPEVLRDEIYYHLDHKFLLSDLKDAIKELITTNLNKIVILDQIFLKAPLLDKSVVVYRGLRGAIATRIIKMKKGDEIVMKGFNSTAFDFNVSLTFGSFEGNEQDRMILRIMVPKNTSHILLPGGGLGQHYGEITFKKMMETVWSNDDQTELVLNRGSRLLILSHEKHLISPRERLQLGTTYKSKKFIHITNTRLIPEDSDSTVESLPSVDDIVKNLRYLQIPITSPPLLTEV